MPITVQLPTEGIFRTDQPGNVPEINIRSGGRIMQFPVHKFADQLIMQGRNDLRSGNTYNWDKVLEETRKYLGLSEQQFDQLPKFMGGDVQRILNQELAPTNDPQAFLQQAQPSLREFKTSGVETRTLEAPALGSLAGSVGVAPGQFQAPQPQVSASAYEGPVEPMPELKGAIPITRNLQREQEFVRRWGGKGGKLPTPEEVNQGVYGTPKPNFATQPAPKTFAPGDRMELHGGGQGVRRNLAAEQEFVKNWRGKGGRLPTPDEVNQGVYGMSKPNFITKQGIEPMPKTTPAPEDRMELHGSPAEQLRREQEQLAQYGAVPGTPEYQRAIEAGKAPPISDMAGTGSRPLPGAPAESVDRGGFGAQQPPEPIPPSGPSPESLLKYGDSVRASGIGEDVWNAMTPDQKSFFSAMSQIQQKNIENQKALVPKSLSAEDMKRFFDEATAEFEKEPYYKNIIDAGKKDFLFNLSQMTGEYDAADEVRKRQLEQGLDVSAEEMAEAGRARSTVRTVAEQRLREGSEMAAESLRRRARGDVEKLGTGFERQFGTSALQGIGIPKVLGQQYAPQEGVGGEFERQKKESIAQYRQFLANEELMRRGVIGPFQFQQPSFITTDVTTGMPFARSVTSQ